MSFLASMIQSDFDVEPLGTVGIYEFLGKRKTDIWHFILAFDKHIEGDNYHDINIRQFHIPRWHLAKAIDYLFNHFSKNYPNEWLSIWENFLLKACDNHKIQCMLDDQAFELPDDRLNEIIDDLSIINHSDRLIHKVEHGFLLPNELTYENNQIKHSNFNLISAIAFEKAVRGHLDAEDFAIYSAFCTMTDFKDSTTVAIDRISLAIDLQYEYLPANRIPLDILDSINNMQNNFLSKRIYGLDISSKPEDAAEILYDAMGKLNKSQGAQFTLMTGMYSIGIMMILSTILGFMTYEKCIEFRTEGLAPDSNNEQFIRFSMPFINLLGQLHE